MRSIFLTLILLFVSSPVWAVTNTWIGTTSTYSTATNWDQGHKPAAGEDVVINNAANMNIDEATAAVNSWNMTGYSGTMSGSADITVTVSSGTSTVLFAGTQTWTGILNLNPAAGTTINLTFGSLTTSGTCGGITIAGTTTGNVSMQDNVTIGATKTVTLTSGTLTTDGVANRTHSWGLFKSTNTNTRTLTLGNSYIYITSNGNGTSPYNWWCSTGTNLTVNKGTSTLEFTGSNVTFSNGWTTGAKEYYSVIFSGGGYVRICNRSGASYVNFTRTGTDSKLCKLQHNLLVVTGSLTLSGQSSTNRLMVNTGTDTETIGSSKEITTAGVIVSANNVDFRDIAFHNHGSLDLTNGGANLIGDCGGNSIDIGTLTITTSATQNFTNTAGGNWSDVANWSGRVPLPQDDVTFATAFNSGVTITADMPRLGRSIDFSGATATGAGVLPTLTLANAVTWHGNINLTNLSSFTGNFLHTMESQSRSGTNYITSGGVRFPTAQALTISAAGTNIQLADALYHGGNGISLNNGTFIDDGFSFSGLRFYSTSDMTRGVLKTGTWTLRISSGSAPINLTSGLTWSDTAGDIILSGTGSSNQNFAGYGKFFNNLIITGGGTGAIIFTGANTFKKITVGYPKTLTFPSGVTTTVGQFEAIGRTGNLITLNASTPGTAATINKTGGGTIQTEWLSITDINVTPANTWYYGNHASYVSGTGWVAGEQPSMLMFFDY